MLSIWQDWSNFRIPRNSFTCHWIRIASIVLCLDLQSLPTHVSEADQSCGVFWSLATGFSVLVVLSCYDRPGVIESSVLFLGLVSQVSGPTQALGWWKRAKERTHNCWLWAWLSRKWPRNENTFEGVIIPCSKFTINVALLPLLRVKY